jgi:hypothetical protein
MVIAVKHFAYEMRHWAGAELGARVEKLLLS